MALGVGAMFLLLCACAERWTQTQRLSQRIASERVHAWVRTQDVDLVGVRARLEVASSCRYRPEPAPGSSVLRRQQIDAANCRTRLYSGAIALTGVHRSGTRVRLPERVRVKDGQLFLSFASVRQLLGPDGLETYEVIELGEGAWAGRINLASLRRLMSSWHLHWIAQGRGAASLFVAAHPQTPEAAKVHPLVVEAQLARQEADYLAVSRGSLSPRAFLERHLWSPYRVSVREMCMTDGGREGTRSSQPTAP